MGQPASSPDGRMRIEWNYSSGRMSHDIWSPVIYDARSGKKILDLDCGSWDASFQWQPDGIALMFLRHYAEGGGTILTVQIDMTRDQFQAGEGGWRPLSEMQTAVPAAFFRLRSKPRASAAPVATARGSGPAAPVPATLLGLVMLLAVVLLGVLGGSAYLTLEVWRLPETIAFLLTFGFVLAIGYGLFRLINRSKGKSSVP